MHDAPMHDLRRVAIEHDGGARGAAAEHELEVAAEVGDAVERDARIVGGFAHDERALQHDLRAASPRLPISTYIRTLWGMHTKRRDRWM